MCLEGRAQGEGSFGKRVDCRGSALMATIPLLEAL